MEKYSGDFEVKAHVLTLFSAGMGPEIRTRENLDSKDPLLFDQLERNGSHGFAGQFLGLFAADDTSVDDKDWNSDDDSVNHANGSWELPIDMQFNDGHIIAIVIYSLLFVLSSVGNITLLVTIVR